MLDRAMGQHIVQQGECLSSLAARWGLEAKDLHDHPDNAGLREKRPYPNILAPGDVVAIPDLNQKEMAAATGKIHQYVLKMPLVKLRVAVLNAQGEPYEGKRFVLATGSDELKGTTGSGGLIEGDVPANAESAQLRVWLTDEDDDDPDPHIDRELAIGHLDPIDLDSGVQARLQNLGYPCTVTGESDDATLVALGLFRTRNGLSKDDDSDPEDVQDSSDAGADATKPDGGSDTSDASGDADAGNADVPSETTGDQEFDEPESAKAGVEPPVDDAVRKKLQSLYEAR